MTWILIISMYSTSVGGKALLSVPGFSTAESCRKARTEVLDEFDVSGGIRALCIEQPSARPAGCINLTPTDDMLYFPRIPNK